MVHGKFGIQTATVALTAAAIMMVIGRQNIDEVVADVEWPTLVFFTGLFIVVGGMVKTGVIKQLATVIMNFKKVIGIDGSPRFTALQNKEVDVIDAFATDGLLMKYHLKVLKDTDHLFPPYYAVPCIREDTLKKYPELKKAINSLSPYLTDSVMAV